MLFQVLVLGVSAALPAHGRRPSAQVVTHNSRHFLLDCGEGTQFRLQEQRVRTGRLDAIFITHLHGDHCLGLPGLIDSLSLGGRTKPLTLVGPKGVREYIEAHRRLTHTFLNFDLDCRELELPLAHYNEPVYQNKNLSVYPVPLSHSVPCVGYRVQEKPRPRKFIVEAAHQLAIPRQYYHLLKNGNAVTLPDGRTITPDQVLGQAPPSYAYAYLTDTQYCEAAIAAVQGVDMIYHEATFTQAHAQRAVATGHSTAQHAAQVARAAGARALLLGHFSARYRNLAPLLDEARAVFPAAALAQEDAVYDLKQLDAE